MRSFDRILRPKSIAVFGGNWAVNVIEQLKKSGYSGAIWPVHPTRAEILGIRCFPDVAALPQAPDASFVGVNRHATLDVMRALSDAGAGGAVCFASGFRELETPSDDGAGLQDQLITAAGAMPFLGPNCYGYINYLDNVTVWPDQHGGETVASGVAIIAQSSNIAINMTMQQRSLPLALMITVGNQAQISTPSLATALLADPRVSAIGLYLEGFGDIAEIEQLAKDAREAGKPLVALKIGRSQKARAASMTHTASLAGSAAASSALFRRLGIAEVNSVSVFLETLKLLDGIGALPGPRISSVSCSGGEASLVADLSLGTRLEFPDFGDAECEALTDVLGDKVAIANPLDYHTYIWGDVAAMTACFAAVMRGDFDLNVFVLDIPREDRCNPAGHDCAIESVIAAKKRTGAKVAVVGLLPENLSEDVSSRFQAAGIVPLHGLETAIAAIDAAIVAGRLRTKTIPDCPTLRGCNDDESKAPSGHVLTERESKAALEKHGLPVSHGSHAATRADIDSVAKNHRFPLVLKGLGVAHKSDVGAVILNIDNAASLQHAIDDIVDCPDGYLVEDMLEDIVAELLIGVSRDRSGLFVMILGAGGVLTELLSDTVPLLLPTARDDIREALQSLKVDALLHGYRGRPAANMELVLDAIQAVGDYVAANADRVEELDINPLAITANTAVALDAVVRLRGEREKST